MPLLMKLPGITGEGTVAEHVGWLALIGFDWGGTRVMRRFIRDQGLEVAQIGPPQLRTATVRRTSDAQSALIWTLMVRKTEIPKITLEWLRTGQGAPVCFFSMEFTGVRVGRISEVSTGEHPVESIDFVYRTVTLGVSDVGNALSGAQDIVTFSVPTTLGR